MHLTPPEAAKYLSANLDKLSPRSIDFATSLLRAFSGPRGASPSQCDWIVKLADQIQQPAPKAMTGSFQAIVGMMKLAGTKLKKPAVVAEANGVLIKLTNADPFGKNPGHVYVKLTGGTYAGKISPQGGEFSPSRALDSPTSTAVLTALTALNADPQACATAYGRKTGECCFCSRPLTDARSTEQGYGPICASNFGLPWG